MDGHHQMHIAALAAFAYVIIALLGALAAYVDNYYTESVGQYVAHDRRIRMFHHLQRLSLGYYTSHQTGTLLSAITTDIQTIQGFASSSTLSILVDLLTIVSMLGLMLWLNWDFTLIAVGVTPFLLLFFVSRFKKAVKKATHQVRKEQADIVAVVQQAQFSIDWTLVKPIADIKSTVWQIKGQPRFTNLTLELWEWSTGEVLELSTKIGVDADPRHTHDWNTSH